MQVVELGAPLELRDAPQPEPGPAELLLQVRACGLNFADTLLVGGPLSGEAGAALRAGHGDLRNRRGARTRGRRVRGR